MASLRSIGPDLSMHDLGDVTPQALVSESKTALDAFRCAMKELMSGRLAPAMDGFFKSAAIAVNVIFTARTHDVELPDGLVEKMDALAAQATHGIKKVTKMVAMKKIMEHEGVHHPVLAGFLSNDEVSPIDFDIESPVVQPSGRARFPFEYLRPEEAGQHRGPVFFKSETPITLWFMLTQKGIKPQDMRIVGGASKIGHGVLVTRWQAERARTILNSLAQELQGISVSGAT